MLDELRAIWTPIAAKSYLDTRAIWTPITVVAELFGHPSQQRASYMGAIWTPITATCELYGHPSQRGAIWTPITVVVSQSMLRVCQVSVSL